MHPQQTQIHPSTTSMEEQHQHEHHVLNLSPQPLDHDLDHHSDNDDLDQDHDDGRAVTDLDQDLENKLNYEAGPFYCTDNNPPDSYAVCETKVAEWLDRNTFMERKASVKFACTKNLDPCQTRASRRSVSINQKPKLSIIGFRKKPVYQTEGRSKHNDKVENVRLFRNRSEPGRDYCLLITEPVSPRVSCVGRVGSVRVKGRKAGVWRSFKAAFSNLVQTNRVAKIAA
ncbi:putative calcium/calmodulin-dependent protein kinase [Helianthus anomalus]